MHPLRMLGLGLVQTALLSLLACGGSSKSAAPAPVPGHWDSGGSTEMVGTISSATASGTMTWDLGATYVPPTGMVVARTVHQAHATVRPEDTVVTVTGTALIGGVTVTLSNGQFDPTTLAASADGSDGTNAYHFTGTADISGILTGTFTMNGVAAGTWTVLFIPTSGTVTAYTGTYTNTSGTTDAGYFNLEISSNGQVSGNWYSSMNGGGGWLTGTATATDTTHGTFSASIYEGGTESIGTVASTSTYTFGASPTGVVQGTYAAVVDSTSITGSFSGHD